MKKESINEVITSTSVSLPSTLHSTDDVVSTYENRIKRSIASKVLSSQYSSDSPLTLTNEEMSYLRKAAVEESPFSEVKVITPDPTITLKKGNTEINIKNAATLVKKMEEIYPKGMSEDKIENTYRQPFIQGLKEGGQMENPDFVPAGFSIVQPEAKSVNKNAYEIREDIIEKSINIVKSSTDISKVDVNITVDSILCVAEKLYGFVENKKRNKS